MATTIQRVKAAKGGSVRKSKSEEPDIDFYALPPVDARAETSLEARKKALEEEERNPSKRKSRSKGGAKKRKSNTKKPNSDLKRGDPSPSGESNSEELDPTPISIFDVSRRLVEQRGTNTSSSTDPLLTESVGNLPSSVSDLFASAQEEEPSFSAAARPSELQHLQHLQLQFEQQGQSLLQQQMSMNVSNPASLGGWHGLAGDQLSSMMHVGQHAGSVLGPQPPSSMIGAPGPWDIEPTPLKPGLSLTELPNPSKNMQSHPANLMVNNQNQLSFSRQEHVTNPYLQQQAQQGHQALFVQEQLLEQQLLDRQRQMAAEPPNNDFLQQQHQQQMFMQQQLHQQQSQSRQRKDPPEQSSKQNDHWMP